MRSVATKHASLWLPPLIYMAVIFHFSSESNPLPEVTAHVWDKVLHTLEYSGLGLLLCRALAGEGLGRLRAAVIAVALASCWGASDEWHQSFVPLRTPDVRDWLTDNLGAAVGAGLYSVSGIASAASRRGSRAEPGPRRSRSLGNIDND
jgi:VanZ family protein